MRGFITTAALLALAANAWAIEPGLYGVQSMHDEGGVMLNGLFRIDTDTGAATKMTSLSHDPSLVGASFLDGELYVTDMMMFSPAQFYGKVDMDTGQYTGIHDQGWDLNWHGLASSDELGLTWSIAQQTSNTLVSTDREGNVTWIGETGITGRGMAYDDTHGILYAINYEDSGLYTVDINTGESTLVGDTGLRCDMIGLAYDEWSQTLYLSEADVTNSLYKLNVETGEAALVGELGHVWIDGLAWIPEPSGLALLAAGALLGLRRR